MSAGNCTGVGEYDNASGDNLPLAFTQTGGAAYPTGTELQLPASQHGGTIDQAYLSDVSCTSAGNCVAVGTDTDTTGNTYPVTATESNGTWSQLTELALPADADGPPNNQYAALNSVSCWSVGNCVAVGDYQSTDDAGLIAAQINGGAWRTSKLSALPTGTVSSDLYAVSCTADGTCTAGGAASAGNGQRPLAVSGSGASLGSPQTLTLPAGEVDGYVVDISCPSDDACSALGEDDNGTTAPTPMVVWAQSGVGTFGAPTPLAAPANAGIGTQADYDSISCPSAGTCTVAGGFDDGTGSEPAAISETGGTWGPAAELSPPAGAVDIANGDVGLAVSCTAADVCGAAGSYPVDAAGDSGAMTLSSHPGLGITTTTLPAGIAGTPYSAQLAGTGGTGTDSWSLSSGTLPAGLTLNAATGVISGTPTTPETLNFTAALGDSVSDTPATQPLGITVNPPADTTGTTGVSKIRVKGLTVHATVSCAGPSYDTCTGALKATVTERVRGHKVVSISASRHPGKHKSKTKVKKRTIVLASVHYSLHGGEKRTLTLHLGRKTARLLSTHHRLAIGLTLTAKGATHPKMERKLVLRVTHHVTKTKHHKKHKSHKKH